ncbi:hypothetical protein LCGC14_2830130 [marine sediment metagenome]|uniref:Zona occludens toxin N-terminal domain-containing protein n=1 Tax=marine sediment metagenome TaxID=412755 RepID=A0A0F8YEB3_9ZZZZ
MKIQLPGRLWNFRDDKDGNEIGEFFDYKEDNEVYVDGIHYSDMKNVYARRQKNKWDNWILYCGDEGDGKSMMAKEDCYIMAHLCDGKFGIDQISWQPKQFGKLIDISPPGYSVLYDEGITGLDTQRTMSEVNHILRVKSTMCRKKRLFVAICIPSLFDIQKGIAIRRSFGMVKIYTNETKRGMFTYYNRLNKRTLYIKGKRYEDMNAHKGGPPSRFLKWSFIDEKEYEIRKEKAHQDVYQETDKFNKYKEQRNVVIHILHKKGMTHRRISERMKELTSKALSTASIQEISAKY